jgi:D-alanine-D-alanine ligase-like ATP-grasp enzyme
MLNLISGPASLKPLVLGFRAQRALRRRSSGATAARGHRSAFYERAWRDAAAQLGATVTPLADGILEIRHGNARTRVCNNETPLDDPLTLAVAGNKPLVYRLLTLHGLPVPRHAEFTLDSLHAALEFRRGLEGDCVVKPAQGTGAGDGVTTGIRSRWKLTLAACAAAVFGPRLLIEEQIPGETYRLLYLDGRLLDAVVRRAPTVAGDGRSTIAQLVTAENRLRATRGAAVGQTLLTIDLDMRQTLAAQGLSLASVLAEGSVVRIKTVANENGGLDNWPAVDALSPEVIAQGAEAARAIGARLVGVDVLTPDPGRPLADSGGVILEVNTTPGYYYHYHRQGPATPVAVTILEVLLKESVSRSSIVPALESALWAAAGVVFEPSVISG